LRELAAEPLYVIQADLVELELVFVDLGGVLDWLGLFFYLIGILCLLFLLLGGTYQVLIDFWLVLEVASLLLRSLAWTHRAGCVELKGAHFFVDLADYV